MDSKLSSKILIMIIISIIVYSIIFAISDIEIVFESFQKIKGEYLALSILLIFVSFLIRGIRWYLMLKELQFSIPFKQSIIIYLSGNAFFLTPGRVGEVIRSHTLEKLYNVPFRKSAVTVLAERIYEILGVIIIASIVSVGLFTNTVFYIPIIIISIIYFLVFQKKFAIKVIKKISKIRLFNRFNLFLEESMSNLGVLLRFKISVKTISLTITSWILESLSMFVILYSFDIPIELLDVIFIYVVGTLIGSATLIPGGIGATDSTIIAMLIALELDFNLIITPILISRFLLIYLPLGLGLIIHLKIRN